MALAEIAIDINLAIVTNAKLKAMKNKKSVF